MNLPNPYTQRKLADARELPPRDEPFAAICGAHQPRYREATCQYFGRLLHQPEGSGAEREDRLVYGEGLCDVDSALDLLARHIVDQRPRISYSATGAVFRRTFLPTLPVQKCGNSSPKVAAAPVALSGAHNETFSVAAMCLSYPNCSPRGING